MSSDITIIYNVEKAKELIMLGKKKKVLLYITKKEASYSFFYSFHWENSTAEILTFFFSPLKTPHKKLASCVSCVNQLTKAPI